MASCHRLIQAQCRQACVGKGYRGTAWDRLLPVLGFPNPQEPHLGFYRMPEGSLFSEKFRGKKLSKQKFGGKLRPLDSARYQRGIFVILTRDIGLGTKISRVLASRSETQLMRIFEFINGLVDSLWLANELLFVFRSEDYRIIRQCVRKVFRVGATDPWSLVDQWKTWTSQLFHEYAESVTLETIKVPRENIFRTLNALSSVKQIRAREGDEMLLMQMLSHLTSTRQMPYMGSKTERIAKEKYKSVLTSPPVPTAEHIVRMSQTARRIGSLCKAIRPGPIHPGCLHFSVTSSGEYSFSVKNGAQAQAVMDAIRRHLAVLPRESSTEQTPFGEVQIVGWIPLWKTLFRKTRPYGTFLEEDEYFDGFFDRIVGLDEVTGKQLMYVAWKEISPTPTLRATVVPELGNKARLVTLSEYWLGILEAPLAHLLVEAMKFHPSVFSSFHRQDQAFEAVKGLCKLKPKGLRSKCLRRGDHCRSKRDHSEAILSSDLSDATNAQDFALTKAILRGFINGYGLADTSAPYVNLVLDLIGPRIIILDEVDTIVTTKGIMMGEPIAKPSLTLLNLCVEELSFLWYTHSLERLEDNEPSPYRDWRYVHIGGDDHLARGPISYLKAITRNHVNSGSIISVEKHGYSTRCVKYTERLINLKNLVYQKPFDEEDYSRSIIVDSVKVRLLERGQSTLLKKDNKNVAIGKSRQLAGCLEWLPKDDRYYTEDKKLSIRKLFIQRMGPLLPKEPVNPRAFASVFLPTIVGGYGLGLRSETKYWALRSPEPTKWLISKILLDMDTEQDRKIFRKLNSNISSRGIESIIQSQEKMMESLRNIPGAPFISWKDLKAQFPNDNPRWTIAQAADHDILSIDEFVKRVSRGNLFQKLLLGQGDLSVFNTRPYVQTYKHVVWPYYEANKADVSVDLEAFSNDEIAKAISKVAPNDFIDAKALYPYIRGQLDEEFDAPDEWIDESQLSDFERISELDSLIRPLTKGQLSLTLPPKFLGIKL
nr:MAG: putative RNA-dependent RNA polymerase [Narnaviridae sp.]